MRSVLLAIVVWMLVLSSTIQAASKPHSVSFGQPMRVKLFVGTDESKSVDLKVRALYVDGKVKEFTTGDVHDVTEHQFTVQRAYRVNDSLPEDERSLPKWKWQRGGWLLVDRISGRVSPLRLPDFDAYYSDVAWYREYGAYCGTPDGEKLYAIVAQIGVRKPLLRKLLRPVDPAGESLCGKPAWQRQPARVSFDTKDGQKLTFTVRGREIDVSAPEPQSSDEESN